MRGELRVDGNEAEPAVLTARVVRYCDGETLRFSWHGDLRRHLAQHGQLVLDDGTEVSVVVGTAFLRAVAPEVPSHH